MGFSKILCLGWGIDCNTAAGAGCWGHSKSKLHRAKGSGAISAATRQQCPGGCGAGAIHLCGGAGVVRRSQFWLNGIVSRLRHETEVGTTAGSTEGRSAPSTHQRSCRCSGLSPNHLRSSDPGWFSWASQWNPRVRCRPLWPDQLKLLRLAALTCEGRQHWRATIEGAEAWSVVEAGPEQPAALMSGRHAACRTGCLLSCRGAGAEGGSPGGKSCRVCQTSSTRSLQIHGELQCQRSRGPAGGPSKHN